MRSFALAIFTSALYLVIGTSQANAMEEPGPCSYGCRYSFTLSGKIQGINPGSPLAQYNGADYTVTGYFTNTGALDISQIRMEEDPGRCAYGCVAEIAPDSCNSGCLTAVNNGGKFTVSLKPSLTGTFGTIPNISTQPTIKLVFPDPTGTMTLADLPGNLQQLEAIQFPTLGLSTTGLSETWAPSVSTFQLGLINTDAPPGPCNGGGCKYSFSLSGKIQGVPSTSPLAAYNGSSFTTSGDFSSDSSLNFGTLKIVPPPGSPASGINADLAPDGCRGGGCLVADDAPEGCSSGCKFNVTLNPALLFSQGSLTNVNATPTIMFTFDNPNGTLVLETLQNSLTKLEAVTFPSLGLNTTGISETWTPTVTTYSLLLASVPPPTSTITAPVASAFMKGTSTTIAGTADGTNGPGLQKVEVGITPNGGTTTWSAATGTATWSYLWTLPADGIYTIQSKATDTNSLAETPASGVTVTVDNTPPTLTWGTAKPTPNAAGWYNTNVSLPFTPADNLSGVASTSSVSPFLLTTEGTAVNGTVTVTDKAGNSATFTSAGFKIDKTAPKVDAYALPSEVRRSNRNASVLVFGAVADSLSGPDLTSNSSSYTIADSAGTNNASGKFTVTKLGPLNKFGYAFNLSLPTSVPKGSLSRTYNITVRTKDKAGNVGTDSTTFVVK